MDLFDNEERGWRQPAAIARRDERLFGKSFAVRRIEEGDTERLQRMRRAEPGRIAAKNACHAAKAESLDILAQQRACFRAVIDGTARTQRRGEIASMPSAPVPEKRSSTRAPLRLPA